MMSLNCDIDLEQLRGYISSELTSGWLFALLWLHCKFYADRSGVQANSSSIVECNSPTEFF